MNIKTLSFKEFLMDIWLTEEDLVVSEKKLEEIIGNLNCNKIWFDAYKEKINKENK